MNYAPFDGDGRHKVVPVAPLPYTLPIQVTKGQARATLDRFVASGESTHSASGATLWVVIAWCQQHRVPYVLTAYPGDSYHIKKGENL